jgi:hypothetical protein
MLGSKTSKGARHVAFIDGEHTIEAIRDRRIASEMLVATSAYCHGNL